MSCSPNTGTVPPYSTSPNPYPAAVYPVRSTYPQQNPYAQVRARDRSFPTAAAPQSKLPTRILLSFVAVASYSLMLSVNPEADPFKCDSAGVNTVATARRLLHAAAVRRAAARHPPHDRGAAQRDARRHVRPAHPHSPPQRHGHGNGSGHHYGHVCR